MAATVAAFGAMLVAPTAAHAAPDASACSAPGTYSYLYGNTYRLIGAVDNYRYWEPGMIFPVEDLFRYTHVNRHGARS